MKNKTLKIILILFLLIGTCLVFNKNYATTVTLTFKYTLIWNVASSYYYFISA